MTQLASHRLLIDADRWARLRALPDIPILQKTADALQMLAEPWVDRPVYTLDETSHNWHLIRARQAQTRVFSLLTLYGISGERRYREAAMMYLRNIASWEYWSWIAWRQGNADPNAIFDLSYGENAFTLALAYDWLAEELTPEERTLIVDTARLRALQPYIARTGMAGTEDWFYRRPDSNWNTVCNGGAGMLALALGEACPENTRVIELVEEGIRHYFEFLDEDGVWPEGIGYWGYGHRYGYYYLLSWERVHGRPHPLLQRPGSRNTLRFPLLFAPYGVGASFGDVNDFFPLPFHLAAAQRYGMKDVVSELNHRFTRLVETDPLSLHNDDTWPSMAELLLLHPGKVPESTAVDWPRVAVQRKLEWTAIADQWPQPQLYASVRGGTTDAPHTHQDLTSLFVFVGDEPLIFNVGNEEYIDSTFSPRRYELYEMSAASKNVMLVNGLGLPHPATIRTTSVSGDGWEGVLLDATESAQPGGPVAAYQRAVLMLNRAALLVLDRVVLEHEGLAEARFHTYYPAQLQTKSATIRGKRNALHLSFAANVPAVLKRGLGLPTFPAQQADNILRWQTRRLHTEMVLATLLTPNATGRIAVNSEKRVMRASGEGFTVAVPWEITR